MIFLADESIDRQIVDLLRREGHQVIYIAELDPGISDDIVLSKANEAEALLITADKDFGELIFRKKQISNGVLLIRLLGLPPRRKAQIVISAIKKYHQKIKNSFTVISPGIVRIRSEV